MKANNFFDEVYKAYRSEVLSFIQYKIHNNEVAEELCNDAFLKIYTHINDYDSKRAQVRTWVYMIVNNIIIDYYRSRKLDKVSLSELKEKKPSFDIINDSDNINTEINNFELMNNINLSIEKLTGQYKTIAKLYFIDELSYNEISDSLMLPLGTVKGTINRIREKLQNIIRNNKEIFEICYN